MFSYFTKFDQPLRTKGLIRVRAPDIDGIERDFCPTTVERKNECPIVLCHLFPMSSLNNQLQIIRLQSFLKVLFIAR